MNTGVFLRDWQCGDVVTAADLQALADAVAMLESAGSTGGAAPGGRCRRVTDGPQGWPWQVVAVYGADGYVLRVVRGRVLVGAQVAGGADGEAVLGYSFLELPEGAEAEVVQDYAGGKQATVWLELTGRVVRRFLTLGEMDAAGLYDGSSFEFTEEERGRTPGHEVTGLEDARLRVTCAPSEEALRVWPLAVVDCGFDQPVTQLQWGDLSALECRGVAVDVAGGGVLWPAAADAAAVWGDAGHAQGMAAVAPVVFSTAAEGIDGTLFGRMEEDGALEFYLGQYEPAGDDDDLPPDELPWGDDEGDDDGGADGAVGPFSPVDGDDEEGDGAGGVTRVRVGYIAGEGFLSCDLVRDAEQKLFWRLVLDGDFLSGCCAGLPCAATVTVRGDGVQVGVYDDVEMGLGEVSVTADGMGLQGEVALVFAGTDGDDVSVKEVTREVCYRGNPVWTQARTWFLTPNKVHSAGRYVVLERAAGGYEPGGFVEAKQWYRFRVDKAAFVRAARNEFKRALEGIAVEGEAVAVSADSEVVGEVSGSVTAPVFSFKLQDA